MSKRRRTAGHDSGDEAQASSSVQSARLPGVSCFADAAPYPVGHPLAGSPFDVPSLKAPPADAPAVSDKHRKIAKAVRVAGDLSWIDPNMSDWDPNDFRLFVSNVGPDVTTEMLTERFAGYPSLLRTHVVVNKKTGRSKGFAFVSFADAGDYLNAFRDMQGKYLGSRPMHLKKSTWKERDPEYARLKEEKKPIWLR